MQFEEDNKESIVITDKNINDLKIVMLKKYGQTSYKKLSEELGVSRTSIYNAINNEGSLDKLRHKIIKCPLHIRKNIYCRVIHKLFNVKIKLLLNLDFLQSNIVFLNCGFTCY